MADRREENDYYKAAEAVNFVAAVFEEPELDELQLDLSPAAMRRRRTVVDEGESFDDILESLRDIDFESLHEDEEEEEPAVDNLGPLLEKYGFAIPTNEALATIAALQPIVEIGAGKGFWASLLRKDFGVDIVAYDRKPPKDAWTEVLKGTCRVLKRMPPERALFLCWPWSVGNFSSDCLKMFRGDTFIYVGEPDGGKTGNVAFHLMLDRDWDLRERVELPSWDVANDDLYIFTRRQTS